MMPRWLCGLSFWGGHSHANDQHVEVHISTKSVAKHSQDQFSLQAVIPMQSAQTNNTYEAVKQHDEILRRKGASSSSVRAPGGHRVLSGNLSIPTTHLNLLHAQRTKTTGLSWNDCSGLEVDDDDLTKQTVEEDHGYVAAATVLDTYISSRSGDDIVATTAAVASADMSPDIVTMLSFEDEFLRGSSPRVSGHANTENTLANNKTPAMHGGTCRRRCVLYQNRNSIKYFGDLNYSSRWEIQNIQNDDEGAASPQQPPSLMMTSTLEILQHLFQIEEINVMEDMLLEIHNRFELMDTEAGRYYGVNKMTSSSSLITTATISGRQHRQSGAASSDDLSCERRQTHYLTPAGRTLAGAAESVVGAAAAAVPLSSLPLHRAESCHQVCWRKVVHVPVSHCFSYSSATTDDHPVLAASSSRKSDVVEPLLPETCHCTSSLSMKTAGPVATSSGTSGQRNETSPVKQDSQEMMMALFPHSVVTTVDDHHGLLGHQGDDGSTAAVFKRRSQPAESSRVSWMLPKGPEDPSSEDGFHICVKQDSRKYETVSGAALAAVDERLHDGMQLHEGIMKDTGFSTSCNAGGSWIMRSSPSSSVMRGSIPPTKAEGSFSTAAYTASTMQPAAGQNAARAMPQLSKVSLPAFSSLQRKSACSSGRYALTSTTPFLPPNYGRIQLDKMVSSVSNGSEIMSELRQDLYSSRMSSDDAGAAAADIPAAFRHAPTKMKSLILTALNKSTSQKDRTSSNGGGTPISSNGGGIISPQISSSGLSSSGLHENQTAHHLCVTSSSRGSNLGSLSPAPNMQVIHDAATISTTLLPDYGSPAGAAEADDNQNDHVSYFTTTDTKQPMTMSAFRRDAASGAINVQPLVDNNGGIGGNKSSGHNISKIFGTPLASAAGRDRAGGQPDRTLHTDTHRGLQRNAYSAKSRRQSCLDMMLATHSGHMTPSSALMRGQSCSAAAAGGLVATGSAGSGATTTAVCLRQHSAKRDCGQHDCALDSFDSNDTCALVDKENEGFAAPSRAFAIGGRVCKSAHHSCRCSFCSHSDTFVESSVACEDSAPETVVVTASDVRIKPQEKMEWLSTPSVPSDRTHRLQYLEQVGGISRRKNASYEELHYPSAIPTAELCNQQAITREDTSNDDASRPPAAEPRYVMTSGNSSDCWHEIIVTALYHNGRRALLLTQRDVSAKARMEAAMAEMTATQIDMLSQIFPMHVLEFLMSGGSSSQVPNEIGRLARSHQDVSIMFMDIVGFTSMSKQVAPEKVLVFLNELFSIFDDLASLHGVQKVETAGDCYIVASGIVETDKDGYSEVLSCHDPYQSAARVFAFAKDMLASSKLVLMPHDGTPVVIRIGVHSGPCVSGLIGSKLPKFSLFGDTMNTASRMESTCTPCRIQVSSSTYTFLMGSGHSHPQEWEATGGVEVKGKGIMETYMWREQPQHDYFPLLLPHQLTATDNAAASLVPPETSGTLPRVEPLHHSTFTLAVLTPHCGTPPYINTGSLVSQNQQETYQDRNSNSSFPHQTVFPRSWLQLSPSCSNNSMAPSAAAAAAAAGQGNAARGISVEAADPLAAGGPTGDWTATAAAGGPTGDITAGGSLGNTASLSNGDRHTVSTESSAVVSGSLKIYRSSALYELMQMNSTWLGLVTASNSGSLPPVVASNSGSLPPVVASNSGSLPPVVASEEPDSATVALLANNTTDCDHSLGAIQNANAESNVQHPQVPSIRSRPFLAAPPCSSPLVKLSQQEIATTNDSGAVSPPCVHTSSSSRRGVSGGSTITSLVVMTGHRLGPSLLPSNVKLRPSSHDSTHPPYNEAATAQDAVPAASWQHAHLQHSRTSNTAMASSGRRTHKAAPFTALTQAMSQAQKALEDAGLCSVHPLMKQGSFVAKQQPSRERAE